MDESLDDYISKSNFKVKIGNPKPKGNIVNKPNSGGFQGNRRFTGGGIQKLADVSVTIPAVRKTGANNSSTNQMRDARERLVSKAKPVDARDRLNQKAQNTDARQKLLTIRSQKGPQDARAKIQAKKLLQTTRTQGEAFNLTRTVNNNIQLNPGLQGNINITKTLTKVMPPGYENIVGPPTNTAPVQPAVIRLTGVKSRLGPTSGPNTSTTIKLAPPARLGPGSGPNADIPNITRTISNPLTARHTRPQQQIPFPNCNVPPIQLGNVPSFQPVHRTQIQPPAVPPQPSPVQVIYHGAPPQQCPPPSHIMPPQQYPPPTHTAPYPFPQQQVPPPYPQPLPSDHVMHQPVSPTCPPEVKGPPYPINDPVFDQQLHHGSAIPKIQVQNDQYRSPEPPYPQYVQPPQYAQPQLQYAPPQPQYAPPQPQYVYPQSQEPVYYEQTAQETFARPQARLPAEPSGAIFKKTIVNDVQPQQFNVPQTVPLKRKSPGESIRLSTSRGSEPLRLSTSRGSDPLRLSTSRGSEPLRLSTSRGSDPLRLSTSRGSEPLRLSTSRGSDPLRLSTSRGSEPLRLSTSRGSEPLRLSTSRGSESLRLSTSREPEPLRFSTSSGALTSSSTNYVPIIGPTGNSVEPMNQKPLFTKITAPGEPMSKRLKEEEDDDVISPLQGFKIAITNLALTVTQDDIIELFGAIGAVKSVRLVKQGTSEVVYVKRDDAVQAAKTYHDRELDGQPMVVKLMTPMSARIKEVPDKLPPSVKPAVVASPLKFSKVPAGKPKAPDKKEVDVVILHKALFKSGPAGPSKPVTFTVNI